LGSGVLARAFNAYFQHVVPVVGGIISGDPMAYRYLPASVRAFPPAERLADMYRAAGFSTVAFRRLGFGSIAIHVARRT
jgi:demethylmenaquinone methyltransferase/2-methoxy-6-polyprenyl-1,4-benzoquinol methylase